jgi:hypothetical protein
VRLLDLVVNLDDDANAELAIPRHRQRYPGQGSNRGSDSGQPPPKDDNDGIGDTDYMFFYRRLGC